MTGKFGHEEICRMLQGAVGQIRGNHEMLSRLDAAVGDGDHGTTILRTMEAVAKATTEPASTDLREFFSKLAWSVMSCDGGSTGPLLGAFFMGMSETGGGKQHFVEVEVSECLIAGIAKLHKQSKANIGDKTMMDAFLPAMAVLKEANASEGLHAALAKAAAAAAQGAEATKNMKARFGRARNLGDRVLGHADPGAVSASLILKGLSEAV
jgi:dihydroxyacetone kinase-like protein